MQLVISDACLGLSESIGDFFPEAHWQRCTVGSLKNLFPAECYPAIQRSFRIGKIFGREVALWGQAQALNAMLTEMSA